jgi:hypothetical protein
MRFTLSVVSAAALALSAANVASAQATAPAAAPAPSSDLFQTLPLHLMLQKGIITQAEYDSAVNDLKESVGSKNASSDLTNIVVGKWSTSIYGFAEGDYIYDSTQGFIDIPGAPLVARPGTYSGDHSQMQFSTRNSRIGLRLRAPEYNGIRASALFEGDFNVTVPGTSDLGVTSPSQTYQVTENNLFTNPFFRTRHFYMKLENPIVDVIFGQTWHLFGWESEYFPNTVQPQGIPGQVYSRTPQVRLNKSFKGDLFDFDIAVAAMRPPQRASSVPEGEGGLHLAFNKWTGAHTISATGTTVSPLSVAVTGDVRKFSIPQFSATPADTNNITTTAISVEAFIPVIPATKDNMGNSLSLVGEAVSGSGIVDMFTGLSSGVSWPSLPATGTPPTVPVFNPLMDPGYVTYNKAGDLVAIQWNVYRAGAQYFLPGLDGKLWVSGNFSYVNSPNAPTLNTPSKSLSILDWFDFNIMGDVTPAIRLGIEYAHYASHYGDGVVATDHRVYASAFFLF